VNVFYQRAEELSKEGDLALLRPWACSEPKADQNVPIRPGDESQLLTNVRGFAPWSQDFGFIKRSRLSFRAKADISR